MNNSETVLCAIDRKKSICVVTNYKCGYSWIQLLDDHGLLLGISQNYTASKLLDILNEHKDMRVVFLLRDPLERFKSLYRYIFRKMRWTIYMDNSTLTQVRKHFSREDIENGNITMSDAIGMLEKGFSNLHADPQYRAYELLMKYLDEPNRVQIIEFKPGPEMKQLERDFGMEEEYVGEIRNSTKYCLEQESFDLSGDDIARLKLLYTKDFELWEKFISS